MHGQSRVFRRSSLSIHYQTTIWANKNIAKQILLYSFDFDTCSLINTVFRQAAQDAELLKTWVSRNIADEKWKLYQPITSGPHWMQFLGEMEARKTPLHIVFCKYAAARMLLLDEKILSKPNSGAWGIALAKCDLAWLNQALKAKKWRAFLDKHSLLLRDSLHMCVYWNLTGSEFFFAVSMLLKSSPFDASGPLIFAAYLNNVAGIKSLLTMYTPTNIVAAEIVANAFLMENQDQVVLLESSCGKFRKVLSIISKLFADFDQFDPQVVLKEIKAAATAPDILDLAHRVLMDLAVRERSEEFVEALFAVGYHPSMPVLFTAFSHDQDNLAAKMINFGVYLGSELLISDTPVSTYTLLLLSISGATYKAYSSAVFYSTSMRRSWVHAFEGCILNVLAKLLALVKSICPDFETSSEMIWNAMTAGNGYIVTYLQKKGNAVVNWMESTSVKSDISMTIPKGKESSASLSGPQSTSAMFVQSGYGIKMFNEAVLDHDSRSSSIIKWDDIIEAECEAIAKTNLRMANTDMKDLKVDAQKELWKKVMGGDDSFKSTEQLGWMEPNCATPPTAQENAKPSETLEGESGMLRAYGGMY